MTNAIALTNDRTLANTFTADELARYEVITQQIDDTAQALTFAEYQADKSQNTLKAQQRDLSRFIEFINRIFEANNLPLLDDLFIDASQWQVVTVGYVKMFRLWLLDNGYAVSTVNRMTVTVKVYARLAWHSGTMNSDTYKSIDAIETFSKGLNIDSKRKDNGKDTRKSSEKTRANFLTTTQIDKLKASHGTKPVDRRDELLVCLLANLGIRASEVASLTVGNVDFNNHTISIFRQKTAQSETDRDTLTYRNYDDLASAFIAYKPYLLADDNAPLLRASRTNGELTGKPMTRITVSRRIQTLGKRVLGIDNLSSHDLRHTFAKHEYENGSDVIAIRRAGGWKTTDMVDHYIGQLEVANSGLKQNRDSKPIQTELDM